MVKDLLTEIADPELPFLNIVELGIVRDAQLDGDRLRITITPTYSGCPATEMIEASVRDALTEAGLGPVRVSTRRAPAWTTDWISEDGRAKLRDYGIAPPKAMLGMLKTDPKVTVTFETVLMIPVTSERHQ